MEKNIRTYETICLTKVDMPEDKYTALLDRCKSAVTGDGAGEVLMVDDWGRAKIAYPINKDNRARWTYIRFKSMPKGVDEIQRSLRINEFVLRQLTTLTREDGSDYLPIRENMPRELADRERQRDWREERNASRFGRGGGRGFGGGDRGGFGGDRYPSGPDSGDRYPAGGGERYGAEGGSGGSGGGGSGGGGSSGGGGYSSRGASAASRAPGSPGAAAAVPAASTDESDDTN